MFRAPRRARRLATVALVGVGVLGAITWYLVSRHPYRYSASTQFVLPLSPDDTEIEKLFKSWTDDWNKAYNYRQ